MKTGFIDTLILVGRPASGKSEILDFLSNTPLAERLARFHIGELDVLDDFPMLWAWFEEDTLLDLKFGLPRLHTNADGYFKFQELWHVLIERLCLEYEKNLRDRPGDHALTTTLIEFSRGKEHGGYREAFARLSEAVLHRAVILYVNVSFAESLRKNRRRYNPDRPDSILEHGLSEEKMERLYALDDWAELAPGISGFLPLGGCRVPYAVFENEDDVTTGKPDLLAERLETVLGKLWELNQQR